MDNRWTAKDREREILEKKIKGTCTHLSVLTDKLKKHNSTMNYHLRKIIEAETGKLDLTDEYIRSRFVYFANQYQDVYPPLYNRIMRVFSGKQSTAGTLGKAFTFDDARLDVLEKYLNKDRYAKAKQFYDKLADRKNRGGNIIVVCNPDSLLITDGRIGYIDKTNMSDECVKAYSSKKINPMKMIFEDAKRLAVDITPEQLENVSNRSKIVWDYNDGTEGFLYVRISNICFLVSHIDFVSAFVVGKSFDKCSVQTTSERSFFLAPVSNDQFVFCLGGNYIGSVSYFEPDGKFVDVDNIIRIEPDVDFDKKKLKATMKVGDYDGYKKAFREYWLHKNVHNVFHNKALEKVPEMFAIHELFNIFTFDELRPILYNIYHDPEGYGVISNSHALFYSKNLFNPKHSGKIMNCFGYQYDRRMQYPDWKSLVPKHQDLRDIDLDLQPFVNAATKYEKVRHKDRFGVPIFVEFLKNEWAHSQAIVTAAKLLKFLDKNYLCHIGNGIVLISDGSNNIIFATSKKNNDGSLNRPGIFRKLNGELDFADSSRDSETIEILSQMMAKKVERLSKINTKLKH